MMRWLALMAVAASASAAPASAEEAPESGTPAEESAEASPLFEDFEALRRDHEFVSDQVEKLRPVRDRLHGYVDVGFFAVGGDGSGIRTDARHAHFPEFDDVLPGSWVLMGDPLATAVNARGEPADLGPSRAIRHDSLGAGGGASFAVNAVGVTLSTGVGERGRVTAAFDLVPRAREVGDPDGRFLGDFVHVKRAYGAYLPPGPVPLELYAGKFHSVFGVEYRRQDPPDRLTVTPSLLCRYTCGDPIGLKATARALDRALTVSVALTNGSHFQESFPFHDEIDQNAPLTSAARISYRLPTGAPALRVRIGASGALGPQDNQPALGVLQWQWGLDLDAEWNELVLTAEFLRGSASGRTSGEAAPCDVAPCLETRGAYGLFGWHALPWLTPYLRVGWRRATHRGGVQFVYVTRLARLTGGARLRLGTDVTAKAEYTHNRQLGRIPEFADDVFATSLILEY